MAKTVWIRARIKGCTISDGKAEMNVLCGNFNALGESIFTRPLELKDLPAMPCFIKGMINSSQNALVRAGDSWGPLGRMTSRFELKNGVGVYHIVNDFSRDGDIECVITRDDAEKLCLLEQGFPCCELSLKEIAELNELNVERLSAQALKTLEHAVVNRLRKHPIPAEALRMDDRVRAMVIAGIQARGDKRV